MGAELNSSERVVYEHRERENRRRGLLWMESQGNPAIDQLAEERQVPSFPSFPSRSVLETWFQLRAPLLDAIAPAMSFPYIIYNFHRSKQ